MVEKYFWKKYNRKRVEFKLNNSEMLTGELIIDSDASYDFITIKVEIKGESSLFKYFNCDEEYGEIQLSFSNNHIETLTLYSCRQVQNCIFAQYALIGRINNVLPKSFNEIYLTLNGLSHGFFPPLKQEEEISSTEFTTTLDASQYTFDVDICDGLNISSCWTIKRCSKQQFNDKQTINLDMHYVVKIILKESVEISGLRAHIKRLKTVFSLLMLEPLTIGHIDIANRDKEYVVNQLPFLINGELIDDTQKNKKIESHHSLIRLQSLKDQQWKNIFEMAYTKSEFETFWPRFVAGLSYHGFWEYRFLIFVSLFERYLNKYPLPNEPEKKKLEDKCSSIIDANIDDLDPDENDLYKQGEWQFKTEHGVTMKRYNIFSGKIEENILKVIGFNSKICKRLIHIRNAVAHNDQVILEEVDESLNQDFMFLNKLIILLACLSYTELGLTINDLTENFVGSHNNTLLNSDGDKKLIDILNGNIVINVDETDYDYIANNNGKFIVLEHTRRENSYSINRSNTERLNIEMHDKKLMEMNNNTVDILVKTYYSKFHEVNYSYSWVTYKDSNRKIQCIIVELPELMND